GAKSRTLALSVAGGREISAAVEQVEGLEIVEGLRVTHVAPEDTLAAVAGLNARADVLYAEPNYIWRKANVPTDPQYSDLWGMRNTGQAGFNDFTGQQQAGTVGADIRAEQAWDVTTGSSNVVVAVIDEGMDINHPDLAPNVWSNPAEVPDDGIDNDGNGFVDDVNGWDFVHGDKTVFDDTAGIYPPPASYTGDVDDHATHVAGTIGAAANNGQGVAGVNWNVRIMSVKVLGTGGGSTTNIIRGYNYVKQMRDLWVSTGGARGANVRVTNNSYGGPGFSQSAFNAVQNLGLSDILFVAAAGNDALDNFSVPQYPSGFHLANVIPVAATDRFDQLAIFSNFGAREVLMGAPGRGIKSTTPFNTYSFFSGTSMATPHVAGAAALLLAVRPNLSLLNLRGCLAYTGDVTPSLTGTTATGRRLNLNNAVHAALENDTTPPSVPTDLHAIATSGRNVTLQWTAPGDDGNSGAAANYDFQFTSQTIAGTLRLPTTVLPAAPGTTQTATVTLPYREFSGFVTLLTFDNAGNASSKGLNVAVQQNAGSDPYTVTESAPEALSTGGSALALRGDDIEKDNVALPFQFPYFGANKSSVNLSSNGLIYFSKVPNDGDGNTLDAGSSAQSLNGQAIIAGLWDDLRTDRAGGDIFMVQPDANRVIFRWQAVTFDTPFTSGSTRGENPVNFEVELRRDGTIITRYGAGNTQLFPVVGIGAGEPDAYVVASHTSETSLKNLTSAATVTFAPRAVVANVAPNVSIVSPTSGFVTLQPANVKLTANAGDSDGTVGKVDFFNGATLIGTVPASSAVGNAFTFQWNNVLVGGYTLTAVATDNAGATTTSAPVSINISSNQIDDTGFFVRQHYLDFFNRQADSAGLAFWSNNIDSCGFNAQCREVKRIDTSAAFFLSIEFQQTGYLVYRAYKSAFGNIAGTPVPLRRSEFLPDTQNIGQSVVVGQPGWEGVLESNKVAYFNSFVARTRFTSAFPAGMAAATYVDTLFANAGVTPTATERQNAINAYGAGDSGGRAAALRSVAESQTLQQSEFNRAFVLMQYFGYLQRDPDAAPDLNFNGYNFWLGKLNQFNGDFRGAEMVKAFLNSGEYRGRFGTP
ncbi:MAG: S8 family serine peptidase, partial [Pyrinomonadaceae bacterium]